MPSCFLCTEKDSSSYRQYPHLVQRPAIRCLTSADSVVLGWTVTRCIYIHGNLHARTINMGNHGDLRPQEIEGFIRQVQKPRLLPEPGALGFDLRNSSSFYTPEVSEPGDFYDCVEFQSDQAYSQHRTEQTEDFFRYFDFALWSDEHIDETRPTSKSDNSSMPGLTSASTPPQSEEGNVPSPLRDNVDHTQLKAKLKEVKKADDKHTFPPLKPKGRLPYHTHITIPDTHRAHSSSKDASLLSPPASPKSSSHGSAAPPLRGRRKGPLEDGEAVADVRAIGACLCCRLRKVKVCSWNGHVLLCL